MEKAFLRTKLGRNQAFCHFKYEFQVPKEEEESQEESEEHTEVVDETADVTEIQKRYMDCLRYGCEAAAIWKQSNIWWLNFCSCEDLL